MSGRAALAELVESASACQRCGLYARATQTVFGEGPAPAALMLVGEQPGDQEDLRGHPFVGPAGRLLDEALASAGVKREAVYVTNAVKHFKWEPRGKRRIHAKPNTVEIHACHPWLEAEIGVVKPTAIVCLGVTAIQALMGRGLTVGASRGRAHEGISWARYLVVTHHPSALFRAMREPPACERLKGELAADLALAATLAGLLERRPAASTVAG